MKPIAKTNEGGTTYEHSYDHHLEFFSKAGSMFQDKKGKKGFYGNEAEILDLFKSAWIADEVTAFKLLLWLRDCRGGAGNRSGFRSCINWVGQVFPQWAEANLHLIPAVGRWDDLRALFNTDVENEAARMWWHAIAREGHVLAAKWADRADKPLQRVAGFNEASLRKVLSSLRKGHLVETKMCNQDWSSIEYKGVPSVAMSRYTKAFGRNDADRFTAFKEALVKGETTVNASVLFPHDCVRTSAFGDSAIADAQFDALPNYMEGTGERAIVIADTSGSMGTVVSGAIQAVHISQGLALYCSAKIEADNPFYKKFIGFSNEGRFVDWNGLTFSKALRNRKVFDGAVGHTRIDKALDLILTTAKFFNLKQESMPTSLIIVSDMQFAPDNGKEVYRGGVGWVAVPDGNKAMTEVQASIAKWEAAGYKAPKIIYWNTAGYSGSVETKYARNTAMVSGFSPAILKNIFNGDDLTPVGVMMSTLKKYEINVPK